MFDRDYGKGKVQMICEIFDDLLEPHVAELIDMEIKKIHWKYDYQSNRQIGIQPHWHVFCGESEEEVRERQYDYLLPIWDAAAYKLKLKDRFDIVGWKRLYMNAHTFGVEPHMHTDDGDFTMMYYPRMDWQPEWLGGTAIWDDEGKNIAEYSNYVGNRLLIFPAKNNHQAMPVSKYCYELRNVVVFKLYVDSANVDRLDFYQD